MSKTKGALFFLLITATLFAVIFWNQKKSVTGSQNFSSENPVIQFTPEQIMQVESQLPRVSEEKIYFHWTKLETGLRWAMQGFIDDGEMEFMSKATGDRQAAGPGLYLAGTPTSSVSFGSFPVAVKISKGTPTYDSAIINKIFGRNLTDLEMAELGKIVPYVRNYGGDWWVTTHKNNVKNLSYAGKFGATIQRDKLKGFQDLLPILQNSLRGQNPYLEKIFFLSRYLDGLSYLTAMETVPGQPESIFEPENFEAFRKTYQKFLPVIDYSNKSIPINFNTNGILPPNKIGGTRFTGEVSFEREKEKWVQDQINIVLPMIRQGVEDDNKKMDYRVEGIRAGGPEEGESFFVTESMALRLKLNPYIQEELIPSKNGKGFQAHYFYPDVFHYKKLKGKISDELFQTLENTSPQVLWNNTQLRQILNSRLIHELLTEVFTRYHAIIANYQDPNSLGLLRDLISIHPFADKNGRTLRMYYDVAALGNLNFVPAFPLSDLDLLMSSQFLSDNLSEFSESYKNMLVDYIEELVDAKAEQRQPDFAMLKKPFNERPHAKILQAFKSFGPNLPTEVTKNQLNLIRQRRFAELFQSWFSKNWENADVYTSIELFKVLQNDLSKSKTLLESLFQPDYVKNLSSQGQTALLDLAQQGNSADLKFITILSKSGSNIVRQNIATLIPTYVYKFPNILTSTAFEDLLLSLIDSGPNSLAFYQWLLTDKILTSKPGKLFLEQWINNLSKPPAEVVSQFFSAFADSKILNSKNGIDLVIRFSALKSPGIKLGVSSLGYKLRSDFFKSDEAFNITYNLLDNYANEDINPWITRLLSSGNSLNDPRVVKLISTICKNSTFDKLSLAIFFSPGFLDITENQNLFREFFKRSITNISTFYSIWSRYFINPIPSSHPILFEFLSEAFKSSNVGFRQWILLIFKQLQVSDVFNMQGPKIIQQVIDSNALSSSEITEMIIKYGLTSNLRTLDPLFYKNAEKYLSSGTGRFQLLGSKSIQNTKFETKLKQDFVLAQKVPGFQILPGNYTQQFPNDSSVMNYLVGIYPLLDGKRKADLISSMQFSSINGDGAYFLNLVLKYKDKFFEPKKFIYILFAWIKKYNDPKYLDLMSKVAADESLRPFLIDHFDNVKSVVYLGDQKLIQAAIKSMAKDSTSSLILWNKVLLPELKKNQAIAPTIDYWLRTNYNQLNAIQRVSVLLSEAIFYNGQLAASLRAYLISAKLTEREALVLSIMLVSPISRQSPYRKIILEGIALSQNRFLVTGIKNELPVIKANALTCEKIFATAH